MSESPSTTNTTGIYVKSLALIDDLIHKLETNQPIGTTSSSSSTKTNQKAKNTTAKKAPAKPAVSAATKAFQQTYLVVAEMASVEIHPESEKLYKVTINIGNEQTRSLVAGLKKFYTQDELLNRKVIAILNLKPKKLAGVMSEAMILAGTELGNENNVKLLEPPVDAQVGDRVVLASDVENKLLDGYVKTPEERCSPNAWEKIVKELKVTSGKPTYAGEVLSVSSGATLSCPLPDGSEIH